MPLLSIIIPTHERAQYAIPTIQALLHGLPKSAEIVVSDTSAEDRISGALGEDSKNARLTLVRPGRSMNVVEHFNFALGHAKGDYLCFIGDDDFVLPDLIDIAAWAKKRSIEAIKLSFPAHYYWPDFRHRARGDYYGGTVQISKFSGTVVQIDAAKAMQEAAKNLGSGVGDMPRAYAGLVSREVIERINGKHGSIFGGVSPDIYSAALISAEASSTYYVDFPIIVPGSSGASTAGQSASGGHVGKLRENAHIGAFAELDWDPLIPEFYSVPTVWSFSLMSASNSVAALRSFAEYGRLYVRCLIWHWPYHRETFSSMSRYRSSFGLLALLKTMIRGLFQEVGWVSRKLFDRLELKLNSQRITVIENVADSAHAISVLSLIVTPAEREKLRETLEAL